MDAITSPDGRYVVELDRFEVRMSHWVSAPCVRDAATGEAILDLSGTMWHADAVDWDGARVTLKLRLYPGRRPGVTLTLDLDAAACTITAPSGTAHVPLADAVAWLAAYAAGR